MDNTHFSCNGLEFDSNKGNFYTCIEGSQQIINNKMIPFDADKKYIIDVSLCSKGVTDSYVYLMIRCFQSTDPDSEILSHHVLFVKNSELTVTDIGSNTIIVESINKNINNWHPYNKQHSNHIGIYYDGNIKNLPDYVIMDGYKELGSNTITLTQQLPNHVLNKIICGKTIIRNHFAGGSYVYPFIGTIGKEWAHISRQINSTTFTGGADETAFREGTKFFKIGLLANHNQSTDCVLGIKNFRILQALSF